ncbi:unnamed protein product [Angiostrongylus costaricensis]|uniref:Uncharacterized protein n=1 Tax=Angiostrongylus costaricensis TaxID=334426 RepID=A0A158PEU1_ANGCS|nr:unnamed protein product [Angiostrongylus costaricensis]
MRSYITLLVMRSSKREYMPWRWTMLHKFNVLPI